MPNYATRAQIDFSLPPTIIQMGGLAAAQAGNNVPADTLLVKENGIWKYPALASFGAVVVPKAVRLVAFMASFGASSTWSLTVAGATPNTSGDPYPAGDVALYNEASIVVASGSAVSHVYTKPDVLMTTGQTVYLTTTGASNMQARFVFAPIGTL